MKSSDYVITMKVTKIVCHSDNGSMLSLYIEHKCSENIVETHKKTVSGYVAFLNKYEEGSYSFGLIQGDYEYQGHSRGYIWSSRASIMNQIFGVHIIEACVRLPGDRTYFKRAFDIDKLREILPDNWDFEERHYSDGEVYNQLVYTGDLPIEYKCGKRLYLAEEESKDTVLCLNTILQDPTV